MEIQGQWHKNKSPVAPSKQAGTYQAGGADEKLDLHRDHPAAGHAQAPFLLLIGGIKTFQSHQRDN